MQVQEILRTSLPFGNRNEEQSEESRGNPDAGRFSARKTALEFRYGDFSFTLSRSSLDGMADSLAHATPYSRPSVSPQPTVPETTRTPEPEQQGRTMGELVHRIDLLSWQLAVLQEKLDHLEPYQPLARSSGAPGAMVPDPGVVLSADPVWTDESLLTTEPATPAAGIRAYQTAPVSDFPPRFEAVA